MSRKFLIALVAAGFVVAVAGSAAYAQVAPGNIHLSGDTLNVPSDVLINPVTPNCSNWHELWPNYCVDHHQDAYKDNGDGYVSKCDEIVLDGDFWHIGWVGPTFHMHLESFPDTLLVAEPYGTISDGNPECQTWHEVYPNYCTDWHVDTWLDYDLSGTVNAGDKVIISTKVWVIDAITKDIIVEVPPLPSTGRVGTLVLILLLALTGLLMVLRARRRGVQPAS